MSLQPSSPRKAGGETNGPDSWEDEAEQDDFKPLTREEAQQWRARQPDASAWQVVRWQLALTVLVTLLAALITRQSSVVWSVLYGALCILLPTALMAYGLTSSALTRWLGSSRSNAAGASLAGMFFWEGIKILLALALMWSAPRLVPDLSWLGLLAGLVVVLKVHWLGWWIRGRRGQQTR